MLRPYTQRGKTGGRGVLQPALQKLRRQPLQPPREQREAIGDEEDTQQDEQRSGDAVHPDDVGPEPLEPAEEAVQRERRDDEGDGEPQGVDAEQGGAVRYAGLGGSEGENRAQDRPAPGRPGGAERDAYERRAEIAERLVGQLEPPLPHEER